MALPIVVQKASGQPYARTTPAIPLWDTEILAAGTPINELTFYARSLGNSDGSQLIARKTLGETNVKQQRQLPQANRFDCHWLNVKFMPYDAGYNGHNHGNPMGWDDYMTMIEGSWLTFKISDIIVAQCLLMSVPFGPFLNIDGAIDTGAERIGYTGVTHRSNGLVLRLTPKAFPVIGPTESFDISINWNADITPQVDIRVITELWGVFYRPL